MSFQPVAHIGAVGGAGQSLLDFGGGRLEGVVRFYRQRQRQRRIVLRQQVAGVGRQRQAASFGGIGFGFEPVGLGNSLSRGCRVGIGNRFGGVGFGDSVGCGRCVGVGDRFLLCS